MNVDIAGGLGSGYMFEYKVVSVADHEKMIVDLFYHKYKGNLRPETMPELGSLTY